MTSMPNIKTAKPNKACPIAFLLSVFAVKIRMIPIVARIGVKELGFNICMKKLSPEIPLKLNIQPVTVVPILAPIITGTACVNFITPELTKATTITVVADDDWITAVTNIPISNPRILVEHNLPRIFSNFPPEIVVKLSLKTDIPKRNRQRPPISSKKLKIVIYQVKTL